MEPDEVQKYINLLTDLARQLNTFASGLKAVRSEQKSKISGVRESPAEYVTVNSNEVISPLFNEDELNWLHN